ITLNGRTFPRDDWTNLSPAITSALPRKLHLSPNHPISITRDLIESHFPPSLYTRTNTLDPIVTVKQNFDDLGFPLDHPGRSRTDTYYVNSSTVLRTHTSAHQFDSFKKNENEGFLIAADVYRRDAIDRSHYPAFHQMEGARTWDRRKFGSTGELVDTIYKEIETFAKVPGLEVDDTIPLYEETSNPMQVGVHSKEEVAAISAHLKRSCELFVADVFQRAKAAKAKQEGKKVQGTEPLKVRWIEAYFPFTAPSYELEVFWNDDWLEVLGSGVVKQEILNNAGHPDRVGWAFGVGLERIAMLLFNIPDIRLFWSEDHRFVSQFSKEKGVTRFKEFSRYPACYKDVAFWLPSTSTGAGGGWTWHENNLMELVRNIGGSLVEDVKLVDEFIHPKTGRKSCCYRINYRAWERTLTNEETNALHKEIEQRIAKELGVEIR
ncbi:phenylalanyl-tRNA synthetase, partial [Ascobolus immersus RN42]